MSHFTQALCTTPVVVVVLSMRRRVCSVVENILLSQLCRGSIESPQFKGYNLKWQTWQMCTFFTYYKPKLCWWYHTWGVGATWWPSSCRWWWRAWWTRSSAPSTGRWTGSGSSRRRRNATPCPDMSAMFDNVNVWSGYTTYSRGQVWTNNLFSHWRFLWNAVFRTLFNFSKSSRCSLQLRVRVGVSSLRSTC